MIILEMVSIIVGAWKKSALFEILATTMRSQFNVHDTADLISDILSEIPIDVITALMEPGRVKDVVMLSLTNVSNLSNLTFLHNIGLHAKILVSTVLKYCIADLTFIKLGCCVDGKYINNYVLHSAVNVHFYLKLPQFPYNASAENIILLSSVFTTLQVLFLSSPRKKLVV